MSEKPQILQLGSEVLRSHALAVDDFSAEQFHRRIELLLALMMDKSGVGLAAPQLGFSLQLIIIASRPTARYPQAPLMEPVVMVNPVYTVLDRTLEKDWEGCLSVPGVRALVPRYRSINVEYQDINGDACKMDLQGFPARVFQHEYDHLQGLVYLDRVEDNRDIISESEFFKRIAV